MGKIMRNGVCYSGRINVGGGSGGASSLDELTDVTITSPADGDIIVRDSNGYVNKHKSLYPSAPTLTWSEYQTLVDNDEDDPDAEYYIDDVNVSEAYYVETSGQTAITGATSLTFTNSHIKPTSDIRILAEPASCKVSTNPQYKVSAKLSSVGNGTATITFPALAENTEFWLLIECPLATVKPPFDTFEFDVSSVAVTTAWGSVFNSGLCEYDTGINLTGKKVFAYFIPTSNYTAWINPRENSGTKLQVIFCRATSGTITGKLYVMVAD